MKTLLISIVLLTGCAAPGVNMTDAERQACKAESCSVWTPKELQGLARELWKRGYADGRKSL